MHCTGGKYCFSSVADENLPEESGLSCVITVLESARHNFVKQLTTGRLDVQGCHAIDDLGIDVGRCCKRLGELR